MKTILILLFFVFNVNSSELKIDRLDLVEGFEEKFYLRDSNNFDQNAVLDCQSYFQKLDFYSVKDGELVEENFITISECYNILDNILACHQKNESKCLNSFDYLNPTCVCR